MRVVTSCLRAQNTRTPTQPELHAGPGERLAKPIIPTTPTRLVPDIFAQSPHSIAGLNLPTCPQRLSADTSCCLSCALKWVAPTYLQRTANRVTNEMRIGAGVRIPGV